MATETVTTTAVTKVFVGNYGEWDDTAQMMQQYFYAGATRLALRQGSEMPQWLLSDHLGSTSAVLNYDGTSSQGEQRYTAWGSVRFEEGVMPTGYQYTGQYRHQSIGLYYYGARWYDDSLGRFTQPDTIVPEASQGVQAWDRYLYTNANPVRHTDSSGHCIDGLTTVPCLLALIAIAGGAGAAANYEWNVVGHSWWESSEYTTGTAQAAVEGALAAEGVGLAVGTAATFGAVAAAAAGGAAASTAVNSSGSIAVDTNVIITAVEGQPQAVTTALAGRTPVIPPMAAQEYLVKGSPAGLNQFIQDFGAKMGSAPTQQGISNLQTLANNLGRVLHDGDAAIAASAIESRLGLLTNDLRLYNFLISIGWNAEKY
ncbi:MAG: RHS repeat-associated core domain-containing protein [Chloroflexota bacterium]